MRNDVLISPVRQRCNFFFKKKCWLLW